MSKQINDIELDLTVAGEAIADGTQTGLDWLLGVADYLFFYPGNWLLDMFMGIPRLAFVGEYFGMSITWYGGWFSALIGALTWSMAAFVLWRVFRRVAAS